jgi:hypothetical protein
MKLTPYQMYMLEQNAHKYNLPKIVKQGSVIYAPHKCPSPGSFRDGIKRLVLGEQADLIGPDRMLLMNKRGIKLYKDGSYR